MTEELVENPYGRFLTAKEAAKYIGVGRWTFNHLVRDGFIPKIFVSGKRASYSTKDLNDYIERMRKVPEVVDEVCSQFVQTWHTRRRKKKKRNYE